MIIHYTTYPFVNNIFIYEVAPLRATLWDEITIKGRNFGNQPFVGQVTLFGVEHRIIKWSDRQIVFQLEPGKSKSGPILVITRQGKVSNTANLEVYDFFTKDLIR